MRIISLNIWGGRAGKEKLLEFFSRHALSTDVFCLQEVWSAGYEHLEGVSAGGVPIENKLTLTDSLQRIVALLPEHIPYFYPLHGDHYGLLTLVHKRFTVVKEDVVYVYKTKGYMSTIDVGDHARPLHCLTMRNALDCVTVCNFHGLWNGHGKGDSDDRILQSKNILAYVASRTNPVVVCGDFNLLPETESIALLESAPLQNLIRRYKVSSTRTSFYTKPEKFADYVFVSPELRVTAFDVLPDEVSNHAPLLVEIT